MEDMFGDCGGAILSRKFVFNLLRDIDDILVVFNRLLYTYFAFLSVSCYASPCLASPYLALPCPSSIMIMFYYATLRSNIDLILSCLALCFILCFITSYQDTFVLSHLMLSRLMLSYVMLPCLVLRHLSSPLPCLQVDRPIKDDKKVLREASTRFLFIRGGDAPDPRCCLVLAQPSTGRLDSACTVVSTPACLAVRSAHVVLCDSMPMVVLYARSTVRQRVVMLTICAPSAVGYRVVVVAH